MVRLGAAVLLQASVSFVNRAQQFAERRRLFHGPYPVERRPQDTEIAWRKQTDSYDAFLRHSDAP